MTAISATTSDGMGRPTPSMASDTTVREGTTGADATLRRCWALVGPELDLATSRLPVDIRPVVAHHLAGGGKHVRAALALLSASAAAGSADRPAPTVAETVAVPAAVAIELVHNFSLIHDDIIDNDLERRHHPTAWARFGVGPALIAGDALVTLAIQVLLDDPSPERVAAAQRTLEATQLMIGGQAADMAFEERASISVQACVEMEQGKTGALLSCASSIGAVCAGAPGATVDSLAAFGHHLGVAFQAVDDVLGIWGESSRTGKPVGNDLVQRKKTLPIALALQQGGDPAARLGAMLARGIESSEVDEAARLIERAGGRLGAMTLAGEHLDLALSALGQADIAPGPRAELEAIARYVVERDR